MYLLIDAELLLFKVIEVLFNRKNHFINMKYLFLN